MDYKSTYLTDNEGKVLFPHSSIDEVLLDDGKNLRKSGVFHHEGEDIKDIEVVSTQITIGNTTINETQLQALLALLN